MKSIVAVDQKWGIGKDNGLLFSIPEDMKYFREKTLGKAVVMGLNTLRSFPGGRPLRGRLANIVLSDVELPPQEGLTVCRDLPSLLAEIAKYPPDDVFVIGGGTVYRLLCDLCTEAYVTRVNADGGATVFFPDLDRREGWVLASESEPVVSGELELRFCVYRNLAPKSDVVL